MPRTYRDLSIPEYRAAVRSGPYVFPGGGELYWLCSDGGILCHRCVYRERRWILRAIRDGDSSGWRVVAVGNTYNEEPTERTCDHCGADIGDQGPSWSVIVGNIGTVYDEGHNEDYARELFAEYVTQSKANYGRASGEPVTLTCDGDPVDEYPGTDNDG